MWIFFYENSIQVIARGRFGILVPNFSDSSVVRERILVLLSFVAHHLFIHFRVDKQQRPLERKYIQLSDQTSDSLYSDCTTAI